MRESCTLTGWLKKIYQRMGSIEEKFAAMKVSPAAESEAEAAKPIPFRLPAKTSAELLAICTSIDESEESSRYLVSSLLIYLLRLLVHVFCKKVILVSLISSAVS